MGDSWYVTGTRELMVIGKKWPGGMVTPGPLMADSACGRFGLRLTLRVSWALMRGFRAFGRFRGLVPKFASFTRRRPRK
jgi:hypothetical protein